MNGKRVGQKTLIALPEKIDRGDINGSGGNDGITFRREIERVHKTAEMFQKRRHNR